MSLFCYSIMGDFSPLFFLSFMHAVIKNKKEKNFKRARESESSLGEEAQRRNGFEGSQNKDSYSHRKHERMETRRNQSIRKYLWHQLENEENTQVFPESTGIYRSTPACRCLSQTEPEPTLRSSWTPTWLRQEKEHRKQYYSPPIYSFCFLFLYEQSYCRCVCYYKSNQTIFGKKQTRNYKYIVIIIVFTTLW